MTTQQNKQAVAELQLKKSQDENELLLVQIHQLEEELEHYFTRNQELEKRQSVRSGSDVSGINWVDDELPDALAENQRLYALVELLRKVHQLETQNTLNVKLGNILVHGVDSLSNFITVPAKVGKIWRESSRKNPPKALGGKGFEKVIAAYSDGAFKAVDKLLSEVSLAPAIQANGYTVLARQLMNSDRAATAEAARRAYEIDPQPFRLKWLAFRLHEAGDVIEAEAMLDILPNDIKFSESEARQASQLRNEAKHVRQHEAKQKTRFSERRAEVERKLEQLTQVKVLSEEDNELLRLQLHQAQEELERQYLKCQMLEQVKAQLEQEEKALTGKKDEQAKLLADSQEENELLLLQLHQVQEELEKQYLKCQALEHVQTQLELEKKALTGKKDEQAKLLADSQARIEQLTQEKAAVEAEKLALTGKKDEQAKLLADSQAQIEQLTQAKAAVEAERGREVGALKQAQAQLEKEKLALTGKKDEQAKLLADSQARIEQLTQAKAAVEAERGREVDALKQSQALLEKEKLALTGKKDEQAKLLADSQAQIEQLTQEKKVLATQKDEQTKLATQRHDELQKSRQSASLSLKLQMLREADLKDLQTRYQASRAQEEHQHHLLTKLEERLSTASAYFNQIADKEPRILIREERNIQSETAVDLKITTDPTGHSESN
jgi:hypothetical protein